MPVEPEQLRALSIRQPWAELILRGEKTVEYRSQATTVRGKVYIYASLAKLDPGYEQIEGDLPRGLIVGTVEITSCENGNGDFEWILSNPQRLAEPIAPKEQPQPVWFFPFGRPEEEHAEIDETAVVNCDDSMTASSAVRFTPVISAATAPFTPYHSKYFAYELTKRAGAGHADKLAQSISNATVYLNPHQVDAALFAFRSPLSRGAILADEVGLGKTIEAGIIVSQLWAEKKRRILVIVPATLRKQWSGELSDKFFIPSLILESKSFRELLKKMRQPFEQSQQVVICSYQFARAKAADVTSVPWDLVIIDEAHRLRNVYKKDNKVARALRDAVRGRPKILLTATPLQNSLMELFGLVTFVDEHVFGSEEAFRELYAKKSDSLPAGTLANLRARLLPIVQRTLRKQVVEYVKYTKRIPITEDFTPSDDEKKLYKYVSDFLQKDNLHSLPNSQRQLIELVLRKILASSSFAIAATLGTMIDRLRKLGRVAGEAVEEHVAEVVGDDFEPAESIEEEWKDPSADGNSSPPTSADAKASATDPQILVKSIQAEAAELLRYKTLAESIQENAKGNSLITALRLGFAKAEELGSKPKALIFTESRRTQTYLHDLLTKKGYAGKIVLFNGTNSDLDSKRIYQEWLKRHAGQECVSGSPTADMRSALVDEFANNASIMIATESAAEGVNLQFCSLVVNYDLPWNPQRIEQRIGRCHRYGQKHDVVVINFVNRANEADQRVFELLNQKFKLFDGVFGASDEVLGALESGIDIEKRINDIYKRCRTVDEIQQAFDQLQLDLYEQIIATLQETRTKLLENFDEDVHHKLRIMESETEQRLNRYEDWLWALTATELAEHADFDLNSHTFTLREQPQDCSSEQIPLGRYRLRPLLERKSEEVPDTDFHYRPGHPLAEGIIARAKSRALPLCELELNYAQRGAKVTLVEKLLGKSGWLRVEQQTVVSLDTEETLLFAGVTDDGDILDRETCEKLLTIPASDGRQVSTDETAQNLLDRAVQSQANRVLMEAQNRNEAFFDAESDKLDRWADDLKDNLERELKDLEFEIREAKKAKRLTGDLQSKVAAQKRVNELEQQRNHKKRTLFEAQDQIEQRKDTLISDIEARLQQQTSREEVFTVRWRLS
ncbi:SNF2-related protein [Planctomicrobium sp. SH527]|uniref:SNF2-related protein n=1 Tax=Planctomicrobium sp. SH527 TaxID=3448123 RepID=UPI003F5C373B